MPIGRSKMAKTCPGFSWQEERTLSRSLTVAVARFADDFVVEFEHREEADRFLVELRERLTTFDLELHPDKTRLRG